MSNNYNSLRQVEDQIILTDTVRADTFRTELSQLADAYGRIPRILKAAEIEITADAVNTVATNGSQGLAKLDAQAFAAAAQMAGFSKRFRQTIMDATPDLDPDIMAAADATHNDIMRLSRELPLLDGDITINEDGTVTINTDAVDHQILAACSVEVKPQRITEAQVLKDIVLKVRELEDGGLNAVELIKSMAGNYLAPSRRPPLDELTLYTATVTRRHNSREYVKAANEQMYYAMGGE